MPRGNRFRHQAYSADAPQAPYELLRPAPDPPQESDEFVRRMRAVGDRLRAGGVAAIYLLHGTFAGCDALGILTEVERYLPSLGDSWRRTAKQMVDAVFRHVGNYTAAYAQTLQRAINHPGEREIPVLRLAWSGENNHIGRADAAVRLIDELAQFGMRNSEYGMPGAGFITPSPLGGEGWGEGRKIRNPQSAIPRLLLWGHSHAGNVFALASNLLSGDAEALEEFFAATRVYRRRLLGSWELPHWRRVKELLRALAGFGIPDADSTGHSALRTPHSAFHLDFVTFGTPIRYGWDAGGYGRLLHFVSHRPTDGLPPYRAPFPPQERDVRAGAHGDYVQQLGIAGTNFPPNPLSYRALWADLRLCRFLQPGVRRRDLLERLSHGMRVPTEGTTLLVDYGLPQCNVVQHLAGHAVYTRPEWMLFHAEEVARRLYDQASDFGLQSISRHQA
jgi:hypothetical protein